jgi:hypothetical protein
MLNAQDEVELKSLCLRSPREQCRPLFNDGNPKGLWELNRPSCAILDGLDAVHEAVQAEQQKGTMSRQEVASS